MTEEETKTVETKSAETKLKEMPRKAKEKGQYPKTSERASHQI